MQKHKTDAPQLCNVNYKKLLVKVQKENWNSYLT